MQDEDLPVVRPGDQGLLDRGRDERKKEKDTILAAGKDAERMDVTLEMLLGVE